MIEKLKPSILIKNKKATYEYVLLYEFTSGIILLGTEIKSIRKGKVSLVDSYCSFINDELYLMNSHISEYEFGNIFNHEEKRNRKLLLTKQELKKIRKKVNEKGFTIVPKNMFINEKGKCKLTICIAKGKKLYDKKKSTIDREEKIRIKRELNIKI